MAPDWPQYGYDMLEHDYWSPKNYDNRGGVTLTLRQTLEDTGNRATAHLPKGGIESTPEASFNRICDLAVAAQLYSAQKSTPAMQAD
jgi:hypothetical protein